MDYVVSGSDTLERIAAAHDCTVGELMKLNRMSSRMVFPGQKIQVPLPLADDVFEGASTAPRPPTSPPGTGNEMPLADGIRATPGGAVPRHLGHLSHAATHDHQVPSSRNPHLAKTQSAPVPGGASSSMDPADTDCLQRFLKIKVKQLTESDGTVSGTLLVTPNCLMFDPDVSHPLVKEKGQDLYGMVANMEEIQSVSVYKDIGALLGDKSEKKKDIFDPNHVRTPDKDKSFVDPPQENAEREGVVDAAVEGVTETRGADQPVRFKTTSESSDNDSAIEENLRDDGALLTEPGGGNSHSGSDTQLPSIVEEGANAEAAKAVKEEMDDSRQRASSELVAEGGSSGSESDRPRSHSDLQPSTSLGATTSRYSPSSARRSFGKLGRTLSARARSLQGTVTSGAQSVAQTAVAGTKSVAHGVVTHTKSAADTLQTGIHKSASVAAEGAKAAVDVVSNVPGNLAAVGSAVVNAPTNLMAVGSTLFADGQGGVIELCDSFFALQVCLGESPNRFACSPLVPSLRVNGSRVEVF